MQYITKNEPNAIAFITVFAQKEVSSQEAEEIKRMIAQYYFDKAEIELEQVTKAKNITETDIENLAN